MPSVSSNIFRAYDIRGKANTEVTEELCRLVGRGFGSELRERYRVEYPTVIIGRDARTHSPVLERATIEGLMSTGCAVLRIGETPTPVNYFAVCHSGRDRRGVTTPPADGSIQITASHNPKEDNGLKLQLRNAEAFSGEELQKLRKRIEEERFLQGEGSVEDLDAASPYLDQATALVPNFQYVNILKAAQDHRDQTVQKPLKIVVDFGNGVAGPIYGEALRRAGASVIALFDNPDGTFPNHIADPTKHETLKTLQETVERERAHCGIAFDGDGDRVGFIDEEGRVVSPDYLLLLLAEDYLQRHPGAPIVYTVSMSGTLETEIKRLGGKPVMCIVGHSFVERAMRDHGSHLGGEQSGHFFCGDNFYDHDDALVAALRILSIYSQARTRTPTLPFSQLFSRYPKVYQTPEWRPHCPDERKGGVVQKIAQHFGKAYPCLTIDGVRIDFGDGAWALIRQSNTSPRLSICMEARSAEKLHEVDTIVRAHVHTYPEISG